jgi:hypothetical protein
MHSKFVIFDFLALVAVVDNIAPGGIVARPSDDDTGLFGCGQKR